MKLQLPENINEITLLQYQKYVNLLKLELDVYSFTNRKIQIFTGLKITDCEKLTQLDIEEIVLQIDKALNEPVEFKQRFTIEGTEFGFIPNFSKDKFQAKEWFDLTTYKEDVETLHKLMAILFRPIKNKDYLGNYLIEDYKGTDEWSDIMKLTPLSAVNGSLLFFSNLANELINYTQKYTEAELAREAVL
jgi:hypothetical protein